MKCSQNILVIGMLLIFVGIVLLVVGSGELGTFTFFVFPFFFGSTADAIALVVILGLTFFIFMIMMRIAVTYFNQVEALPIDGSMREFIPVGSKCDVCSTPLPVDAVFCSSCGNPVKYDRASNQ